MKLNYCNDDMNCCCNPNPCCEPCCEPKKSHKPMPTDPGTPMNFAASCGSTVDVPYSFDTAATPITTTPKSVACLTLDTTCFKTPMVLLTFNTEIHLKFLAPQTKPASVDFEIVITDGCKEISCGSSTFTFFIQATAAKDTITTNYSFTKLIPANCLSCCASYSVKITNPSNDPAEISLFELRNSTVSAVAKSNC